MISKLLCLLLLSANPEYPVLKVKIPKNYTGWAFVGGTSRNELIKIKRGKLRLKDGIGYIDTSLMKQDFVTKVYKKRKLLSESEVKYQFSTQIQYDSKDTSYVYTIFTFY